MFRNGSHHHEGLALADRAIADCRTSGAIVVDPVRTGIPLIEVQPKAQVEGFEVALAINRYLAGLPPEAGIRTLDQLFVKAGAFRLKDTILAAGKALPSDCDPKYLAALSLQQRMGDALVDAMEAHDLTALILPFQTAPAPPVGQKDPEWRNFLSSFSGLPSIVVPGGFFASDGMPFGFQFIGRPFSESALISVASGYEAVTAHRRPAPQTPALPGEKFEY
jgi:Asp-tRNA(Asn)/Glu-tRNA(Gln) amidotransferase A subunit family amidase